MARVLAAVVLATFGGLSAIWLATLLSSCSPAVDEVAQYAAEQQQCVVAAATRPQADQCRAGSKARWEARWCGEYPDAGMWSCSGGDR